MVNYVAEQLWELLLQSSRYSAVKAIQDSIQLSHYHFFAMLELYNLDTCTFFTPSRELGFALHEMYEVLDHRWGSYPMKNKSLAQKSFIF